jgi:hypothetical protein
MSTVFRVWCADDAVAGPQLHRKPGGTGLIYPDAWGAFLLEHEYHKLVLVHEDMDGLSAPEDALNVEEVWEMVPGARPVPFPTEIRDGIPVWPDGSPFVLTADYYRAAGWKLRRRLVTDWVDV